MRAGHLGRWSRRRVRETYRRLVQWAAPFAIERKRPKYGLNREPRERRIIVSLTSFPPRFPVIHLALKRMLDQTMKPDRLLLYLDDFVEERQIPDAVRSLEPYGLEIRRCPHDLKPHKKYFFAMQEFPDDVVVTVDDDMIYSRRLVETLVDSYRRFPDCVSTVRAHKMAFTGEGALRPYADWIWNSGDIGRPSMRYLATGVYGTLYPPRCLPPEAFDVPAIREFALTTDDIWLKFMEMRRGTRVVICGRKILAMAVEINRAQKESLQSGNVSGGANDRNLAALMAREGLTARDFLP